MSSAEPARTAESAKPAAPGGPVDPAGPAGPVPAAAGDSGERPRPPRALAHVQSLPSWLVGRVAAHGRSLVAEAVAEEGLKLSHHAVLAAVSEYGPVAQAELVRRLGFDAKDVVLLLNHLEEAGLALRRPDPRDRRKNAVTVTPAGARALERCAELAERANAALLAPLSAAEARQLMELLGRVHEGQAAGAGECG